MSDKTNEKKALTAAERQAKRRKKAEEEGLKSCSVGLVKKEHVDALKAAAKASREGRLELTEQGELVRPVVREVEKKVVETRKVIKPVLVIEASWPQLVAAVVLGAVVGLVLGFSLGLIA